MTGQPSYLELGVPDVAAATAFYGRLFGWPVTQMGHGASVHTETLDIGIHGSDPAAQFEVFFVVDDLEASIATVRELGGRTISGITDAPGFGRYVECRDDQGVAFGLRQLV